MYQEKIREYLEAHRAEMTEDIKKLVRVNSARTDAEEGMPFGPGPAAGLKAGTEVIEQYGFHVNQYDNYAIDCLLNDQPLQLDILAHLDVVPAGEGWTVTEPFEPVVMDGKMYGRGTSDDKGPAMAALYAMRAIRDLNIPLKKNVRLILGADEECGSSDMKYYFSKKTHAPMAISPDADFPLIFLEKGSLHTGFSAELKPETGLPRVISVHSGEKINVVPARAQAVIEGMTADEIAPYLKAAEDKTKAAFTAEAQGENQISLTVRGAGAHASSPMDGCNALTAMLYLFTLLPLAEGRTKNLLLSAAKMFPHGDFFGQALGVAREDEISGKLTLTLDLFDMDEKKMSGMFDCRACISANEENTRQVIIDRYTAEGFDHTEDPMRAPHYVPKDSVLVKTLLSSYTKITGKVEEPLAIGGGTYVHSIENGVACGCADPAVDNHMHGPDEFVVMDQLIMSAEIFADAILSLCEAQ